MLCRVLGRASWFSRQRVGYGLWRAIAIRIGNPCLQGCAWPTTSATTQADRRRKPAGGDASIQSRAAEARDVQQIAHTKICGNQQLVGPLCRTGQGRRSRLTHHRRLRWTEQFSGKRCWWGRDLRRFRGSLVSSGSTVRSWDIHANTSERYQPSDRPQYRTFLGNLPIRLRPVSSQPGRRVKRTTSRVLRSSVSGGQRSLIQRDRTTVDVCRLVWLDAES